MMPTIRRSSPPFALAFRCRVPLYSNINSKPWVR